MKTIKLGYEGEEALLLCLLLKLSVFPQFAKVAKTN